MKSLLFIALFSLASFAQNFHMQAVNQGNNIKIQIQDVSTMDYVYEFQLKKILKEGINIKHKEFMFNGQDYVVNIFANQKFIQKSDINPENTQCSRNMKRITYQINAEISFSISVGKIEFGFLKNMNVLEGIENIQYRQTRRFRCLR